MSDFGDAAQVLLRVQLLLQQMVDDGSADRLAPQVRRDLGDVVEAAAEAARAARELIGLVEHGHAYDGQAVAAEQTRRWLPTNRKERFYTGTVLPMLVAHDAFAHVGRFLQLCGVAAPAGAARRDGSAPCQLLTEYGFAESLISSADTRWPAKQRGRDTPDVVLVGEGWLVAVEAKMFDRPSRVDLDRQLVVQRVLIEEWASILGIDDDRAVQVALLPAALAAEVTPLSTRIVTWEAVADVYRVVGPPYWVGVLTHALAQWPVLAARPSAFGLNAEHRLTGEEILTVSRRGELAFAWMGRRGGLDGAPLSEDLATGRWRRQVYELRSDDPSGNPNWFSVESFLAQVAAEPGPSPA